MENMPAKIRRGHGTQELFRGLDCRMSVSAWCTQIPTRGHTRRDDTRTIDLDMEFAGHAPCVAIIEGTLVAIAEDGDGMPVVPAEQVVSGGCRRARPARYRVGGPLDLRHWAERSALARATSASAERFVLAGAKTLVMSLWKVPDEPTRELMEAFYGRLLAGEGRAEALRQA